MLEFLKRVEIRSVVGGYILTTFTVNGNSIEEIYISEQKMMKRVKDILSSEAE